MRPDRQNGKGCGTSGTPAPDAAAPDAATLALLALGWALADQRRADRLLALTGLDGAALRTGIGDPAVLGAILAFLEDYEPDLVACAAEIGATPADLIAARRLLTQ